MPKPTHTGSARDSAQALDRVREPAGDLALHAGHAEAADEIHEAAAVTRDLRHAWRGGRRRDQADEGERRLADLALELRVAAYGKVGDEQSVDSRGGRAGKRGRAGGNDRIEIAEKHQRYIDGRFRRQREHAVERHPLLERALRARLDHRTVRERIREWNADLDHICARLRDSAQQRERARAIGMPGGDVDDQCLRIAGAQRREAPRDEVRRNSR